MWHSRWDRTNVLEGQAKARQHQRRQDVQHYTQIIFWNTTWVIIVHKQPISASLVNWIVICGVLISVQSVLHWFEFPTRLKVSWCMLSTTVSQNLEESGRVGCMLLFSAEKAKYAWCCPRLKYSTVRCCPELTGSNVRWYPDLLGSNASRCPQLRYYSICCCSKLERFWYRHVKEFNTDITRAFSAAPSSQEFDADNFPWAPSTGKAGGFRFGLSPPVALSSQRKLQIVVQSKARAPSPPLQPISKLGPFDNAKRMWLSICSRKNFKQNQ